VSVCVCVCVGVFTCACTYLGKYTHMHISFHIYRVLYRLMQDGVEFVGLFRSVCVCLGVFVCVCVCV